MASSQTSAHPILSLREQVTALEAAITLCMADPKTKPVHRLRTTTRRIEGQLAMLETLPKIPEHKKPAREATRLLKKLRRAAGKVRDIDVQLDLIDEIAPDTSPKKLKADADKLRKRLLRDRKEFTAKLVKELDRRRSDVTLALEALLAALESVEKLALSATELAQLAERWFAANRPPETAKTEDDANHLHAVRKVAKLARYIAENAPKGAKRPQQMAESFEKLQQSGGEWHDWLVLAEISGKRVGASSPLTAAFDRRSRVSLTAYRRHLSEFPV
jgi:CHAD domain-containing protein